MIKSVVLQKTQNTLLQILSAISLRRASCGQAVYNTTNSNVTLVVGKGASTVFSSSTSTNIGIFSLNLTFNSSALSPDSCPPYLTGRKPIISLGTGNFSAVDTYAYQMSYLDMSGTPANITNGFVYFNITLDDNLPSIYLNSALYSPVCAFVKYLNSSEDISTASISSQGCSVVARTGRLVQCVCTHLSDFLIKS